MAEEQYISNLANAIEAMSLAYDHSVFTEHNLHAVEEWLELLSARLGFAGIRDAEALIAHTAVNRVRRTQQEMSQAIKLAGEVVRALE